MKTIVLTTAVLLFTGVTFAQTKSSDKSPHGAKVSSTSKSATDADVKGTEVSSVASSKSKAELGRKSNSKKSRDIQQADSKNDHGQTVSDVAKGTLHAESHGETVSAVASSKSKAGSHRKDDHDANGLGTVTGDSKATVRADLKDKRDELKAIKENAKADRDNDDEALIGAKADLKAKRDANKAETKTNAKSGAKVGAKTGAHVGVGNTKVKTNVGAGLKLGL